MFACIFRYGQSSAQLDVVSPWREKIHPQKTKEKKKRHYYNNGTYLMTLTIMDEQLCVCVCLTIFNFVYYNNHEDIG